MPFDPKTFLTTTINASFATSVRNCPEGEYQAQIVELREPREQEMPNGDPRWIVDIRWEIMDDGVRQELDRPHVYVNQGVFLDFDDEGEISDSDNVGFGRLREAFGQNDAEESWAPEMLKDQIAFVKVEHSPNKRDPENPHANITRVSTEGL